MFFLPSLPPVICDDLQNFLHVVNRDLEKTALNTDLSFLPNFMNECRVLINLGNEKNPLCKQGLKVLGDSTRMAL